MRKLKHLYSMRVYTLTNILTTISGKPKIIRAIERETGCTRGTIDQTVAILEKCGYITTVKLGRVRTCTMTEKGKNLLIHLQGIRFEE